MQKGRGTMEKKNNMKQAMYEMFGVGSDQTEKGNAEEKAAQKSKQAVQPMKKETDHMVEKTTEKSAAAVQTKPKAEASYLAPGTVFEGNIRSAGDVEIAGEFKGNIVTEGAEILHSSIQGNITAKSLKLSSCSLNGDVVVNEAVAVGQHSQIMGNVTAKDLVCAGRITGDLSISENMTLEKTAQITGNITTGTIAVEKGAIIKGGIEIKA